MPMNILLLLSDLPLPVLKMRQVVWGLCCMQGFGYRFWIDGAVRKKYIIRERLCTGVNEVMIHLVAVQELKSDYHDINMGV